MKVLFFIESLRAGGKERRLTEIIKGLQESKLADVELVLTRNEVHYTEIQDLNVPIHIIERKHLKKDPRPMFAFFKLVRQLKPDLIHTWGTMLAAFAIPSKLILGVPLVNSEITDAPLFPTRLVFRKFVTFKFADVVLGNTQAGLNAYNAPSEKSKVIYNGFDDSRLTDLKPEDAIRDELKLKPYPIVAMIATYGNKKDHKTFIGAAKLVLESEKYTYFIAIGDGDNTELIKGIPENLQNRILLLSKRTEVENYINASSIGVLLTDVKNHGEGISNALLEFAALSKPLIGTDNGGTAEIIEHGTNGYLVKPYDEADTAARILELLRNMEKRESMGKAARKTVEFKFGVERMITEMFRVYENTLSQR